MPLSSSIFGGSNSGPAFPLDPNFLSLGNLAILIFSRAGTVRIASLLLGRTKALMQPGQ